MNQSKITVRYAKAFIALGKEKNLLPEFHQDAELVASVCSSSTDFILLLESPVIKTSQKINAIQKVFSGKVNDLTLKFLMLIAQNKREIYIPGIFRNFLDYYRKDQGIRSAIITSAQPLNDTILSQIRKILEKELNATIELKQQVKKELIGGFILRVDDQQYDASLSTQLKKIKESLLQTEV